MSLLLYLVAGGANVYWLMNADRLGYFTQLAIAIITILLVVAGVLLRLDGLGAEEQRRYKKRAMMVLLVYYGAILCSIVFFGGLFGVERGGSGAINLEPFYSIRRYIIHYRRTGSLFSLFNLMGNVVLLFPLGVMLPLTFQNVRRWWLGIPLLVLASIGVELLQWRFGVGVADVDDSILNFAGALLGYLLIQLLSLIKKRMKGRGSI